MSRSEKLHVALLESQQKVLDALTGLTESNARTTMINTGWSVQDAVAHLAAAELGHCQVIARLLTNTPTDIAGFDLDAFNNAEVAARRPISLSDLIAEYQTNRAATLQLLASVGEDDWDRAGWHPGGFETTVEGVFRVIAIHEKRHLREIQAVLVRSPI